MPIDILTYHPMHNRKDHYRRVSNYPIQLDRNYCSPKPPSPAPTRVLGFHHTSFLHLDIQPTTSKPLSPLHSLLQIITNPPQCPSPNHTIPPWGLPRPSQRLHLPSLHRPLPHTPHNPFNNPLQPHRPRRDNPHHHRRLPLRIRSQSRIW